MAWTGKQKATLSMACREAGLDSGQRHFILRQFANAMYDRDGKPCTKPTSTSMRLNQADYENVMAIVERQAGGKVLSFKSGYWQRQSDDGLHRMRHLVNTIANSLSKAKLLAPDGVGLAQWIKSRVSSGQDKQLRQLDYHELLALVTGLRAFARQRGVSLA